MTALHSLFQPIVVRGLTLKKRIAKFRIPEYFHFPTGFPTAVGKTDKKMLEPMEKGRK